MKLNKKLIKKFREDRKAFNRIRDLCSDGHATPEFAREIIRGYVEQEYYSKIHAIKKVTVAALAIGGIFATAMASSKAGNFIDEKLNSYCGLPTGSVSLGIMMGCGLPVGYLIGNALRNYFFAADKIDILRKGRDNRKAIDGKFNELPENFSL